MPNFFILDENIIGRSAIGKQKIQKNCEILLRNRSRAGKFDFKMPKKVILSANYKPFLMVRTKGLHLSLFYDKLLSKAPKHTFKTASCHNKQEIFKANRLFGADYFFISPIFPTKTHENAKTLGILRLFRMINGFQKLKFIVLGGMDEKKFKAVKRLDFKRQIKGFAGIRNFISK